MSGEPSATVGPYEIHGILGRGGMGVVYRARRAALKREFALKAIRAGEEASPESLARFAREAQAAASLAEHPGIVGVHDIGQHEGVAYFAMDLVEGRSLEQIVDDGQIEHRRAAEYIEQAARAIHFAHVKGVLHRDVKPSNLMVTPDHQVRVTDFGLATTHESDEATARLTKSGAVLGTATYMPPEQARGLTVDARADVYALGATLYEAIAGKPPFGGGAMYDILDRVLREDPKSPATHDPTVPTDLETITMKCLEKDPANRYPTAEALASDLARFLNNEPIDARPLTRWQSFRRRVRKNPAPWIAGVVSAVIALVVAGVYALQRFQEKAAFDATIDRLMTLAETEMQLGSTLHDDVRALVTDLAYSETSPRAEAARKRDEAWLRAIGYLHVVAAMATAPGHRGQVEIARAQEAEIVSAQLRVAEHDGRTHVARRALDRLAELAVPHLAHRLEGDGTLSLQTHPNGALVKCQRYDDPDGDGKLELIDRPDLGRTPLRAVSMPMGSYLLTLEMEGFAPVRLPVCIERNEEDAATEPVRLLTAAQIGKGWIYVPGGTVLMGGDPDASESFRLHRRTVPGFLMARFEITNPEYWEFLQALLDEGAAPGEVTARCPRDTSSSGHYWVADGARLVTAPGRDRRVPKGWPVFAISWEDAAAYCHWRSRRDGVPYDLPTQTQWVRAARGADARAYPWGNGFDWSWLVGGRGPMAKRGMRPLNVFFKCEDISPFGVQGLAGSVAEWVRGGEAGMRPSRGGSWSLARSQYFRIASTNADLGTSTWTGRGFRIVRPLPGD